VNAKLLNELDMKISVVSILLFRFRYDIYTKLAKYRDIDIDIDI